MYYVAVSQSFFQLSNELKWLSWTACHTCSYIRLKTILNTLLMLFRYCCALGKKVMNVRLNVVWRKKATVDQRWCPGSGICYTAGWKERLSSGDKVLFINSVIFFGCCHLNTLFILRSRYLLPWPLTWAEQTFSIHPYESQAKPLLCEVDRGSEKELREVERIQKMRNAQLYGDEEHKMPARSAGCESVKVLEFYIASVIKS